MRIAAELPSFWGGGASHALLFGPCPPNPSFCPLFRLTSPPFWLFIIIPINIVFYCAFSQIIPRKVYLGLAKIPVTFFFFFFPFFLVITNKPEFMYPFLKIYQSNFPSLSHGLPSFLGSKTALSTNFKSSAAMVVRYKFMLTRGLCSYVVSLCLLDTL